MSDPFDLERFVSAQDPEYEAILAELRQGRKTSHWMWYVFPQVKGLGSSSTAELYGIESLNEAKAYLDHEVLGPRLTECTELVNHAENRSIQDIFGGIDSLKFRSSMTLFGRASKDPKVFQDALEKYFDGQVDQRTLDLLGV